MPRTLGTYALPAGNPVVNGTTISATTHNNTMSDLATEMTASLPRDGSAAMTGSLPLAAGVVGLPALNFSGDTDTGLYNVAANQLGVACGGALVATFAARSLVALTAAANWTITGGAKFARVWKDLATGMVYLEARMLAAAGHATNPFSAALAAGYRPATKVVLVALQGTADASPETYSALCAGSVATDGNVLLTVTDGNDVVVTASWYGAA